MRYVISIELINIILVTKYFIKYVFKLFLARIDTPYKMWPVRTN